jgi:hypothetical protein
MTRGRGIMGIFSEKWHFSKVLVVWGVKVQVLVVWGAIRRKCDSLGAKLYFFLCIFKILNGDRIDILYASYLN